jgi:5-methylcytosine-specific restriction endonuclease McrA
MKRKKKDTYRPLIRRKNESDRDRRSATKRPSKNRQKTSKKYYDKNREKIINYSRERKRKLYYEVFKLRYQGRCAACGNPDYRVLDFDHLNPEEKIDSISGLVSRGSSWWRIEEEIAKCQLLCANCHRIKTFEEQARYNYEMQYLIELGVMDDPHEIFKD